MSESETDFTQWVRAQEARLDKMTAVLPAQRGRHDGVAAVLAASDAARKSQQFPDSPSATPS